ncbi:MAG: PA2169 family four-helix-bundle protein [Bacillota bacterium]
MATSNETIIDKLNDLIELDFDAIEAYQAAIERLKNPSYKSRLAEFCKDHERHTKNLAELVAKLGGEPSRGPDVKRFLTKGKVVIADIVGDDHAILMAMRANEEVTNKRYELALNANTDMDAQTRSTIEANLGDERRHREWISEHLNDKKIAEKASA